MFLGFYDDDDDDDAVDDDGDGCFWLFLFLTCRGYFTDMVVVVVICTIKFHAVHAAMKAVCRPMLCLVLIVLLTHCHGQ